MSTEFTGKSALVSGAGSGIGRATAIALASEGAAVLACDQDLSAAEQTCQAIRELRGEALAFRCDVRSADEQLAAVALAKERFGGLHVAVNNAGIGSVATPVADIDPAFWSRMIDTNLTGVFLGLRAQIPAILASGGGALVNVSSILGSVGRAGSGAYVAAKHGVVGLTRSAALDYADKGLRINAVGPAFIRTPLISHLDEAPLVAKHPVGRLGRPEEVAQLIVFLLSPRAGFITGGYYPVDGGYLAQ